MNRRRLALVLLLPADLAESVRSVRRGLGLGEHERIAPHVTVVEPTNVAEDAMRAVRSSLRAAVVATAPFRLELGPAASFSPVTPTVHLGVGGDVDALSQLRDRLRVGPFDRRQRWDYQPHVTLRESVADVTIDASTAALTSSIGEWWPDSITLMEFHAQRGMQRWSPLAEEPFGALAIIGRGGVESVLRSTTIVPDDVALAVDSGDAVDRGDRSRACVVSCELPSEPGVTVACTWGLLDGDIARLHGIHVDEAARGQGHGRAVLLQWLSDVASRGAVASIAIGLESGTFLERMGFARMGDQLWIRT